MVEKELTYEELQKEVNRLKCQLEIASQGSSNEPKQGASGSEEVQRIKLLMKDAVKLARLGTYEYLPKQERFYVSPEWLEIYGLNEGDFDGTLKQIYSRVHPADLGLVQKLTKKVFKEKTTFPITFRILRPDKEVRYLRAIGEMELDQEGELERMFGVVQDITDQKLSETKFKAILENTFDLFLSIDNNYKLLTINTIGKQAFKEILKVDIEEGQNILEQIPDSLVTTWKARYDRALGGDRFIAEDNYEYEGVRYHMEVAFNPIFVEDKVTGVCVTSHDVTERKVAEEAIREAKEFAENLIDTANALVVVLDVKGDIQVFNKTAEKITGYVFEELRNRNWFDILVPRSRYPQVWKKFERFMTDGLPRNFENPILTKSGEERYIVWQNSELISDGKITGTVSFGIDITETRQADEALKESEKKFRSFMEMIPAYAYIKDEMNNLIYGNKKTNELKPAQTTVSSRSKFDKTVWSVLQTADRDILEGKVDSKELEHAVDIRGTKSWLRDIKFGIPLPDGSRAEAGLAFDISEIKRYQAELETYQNQLEQLVDKRTNELKATNKKLSAINLELSKTNIELNKQKWEAENTLKELKNTQSQLIQAEKMASLGILTAGVAHEINNPLNFIHNGILALENYFNDHLPNHMTDVSIMINGIKEGVKRSAKIVTSLNHFSRKGRNGPEACDIHSIVENCLVMLQNEIKEKIDVQKCFDSGDYKLIGYEGKLHQAILNLLANAVQSIDISGKIEITTGIKKKNIEIKITDNGRGISKENLARITDPFFTTKPPGKGTGLGLAIAYIIILEHKGNLSFESEVNKGTCATVLLPID